MNPETLKKFPKPFEKPLTHSFAGVTPHYMTPRGMTLLPREMQPPPMFGIRGSTIPGQFLPKFNKINNQKPVYKKPENFYCAACDRNFKSLQDLNQHKREHKTCGIDGCRFVGHPEAINKHVEAQHDSGLYEKFKKIISPEDIEKWRNDRKRKYPTKGNIELRQKIQEEKMQRGERISEPNHRFGTREDRNKCRVGRGGSRGGNRGRGRTDFNRGRRNNNFNKRRNNGEQLATKKTIVEIKTNEKEDEKDIDDFNGKLTRFKGTSTLSDYKKLKTNIEIINPLAQLLGMYGSDEDSNSNDDNDENNGIEKMSNENELQSIEEVNRIENIIQLPLIESSDIEPINNSCLSEGEEPEECIIAKEDDGQPLLADLKTTEQGINTKSESTSKRKRYKRQNNKFNPNEESVKAPPKKKPLLNYDRLKNSWRPNTLLSRLLQPDIRRERNMLLQCVRYVVQNNFFGIGQKNETTISQNQVCNSDQTVEESILIENENILLNEKNNDIIETLVHKDSVIEPSEFSTIKKDIILIKEENLIADNILLSDKNENIS